MKSPIRLAVVFAGSLILSGCGTATKLGQATDLVFDLAQAASGPDGRPVIDIKPNGKPRPRGTGPSGGYFLMVRRNGVGYYTRWFDEKEAAQGVQLDLDIPTIDLKPGDQLTVGVENVNRQNPADYVRLSNVLDLPLPPPLGPPVARPNPKVLR